MHALAYRSGVGLTGDDEDANERAGRSRESPSVNVAVVVIVPWPPFPIAIHFVVLLRCRLLPLPLTRSPISHRFQQAASSQASCKHLSLTAFTCKQGRCQDNKRLRERGDRGGGLKNQNEDETFEDTGVTCDPAKCPRGVAQGGATWERMAWPGSGMKERQRNL